MQHVSAWANSGKADTRLESLLPLYTSWFWLGTLLMLKLMASYSRPHYNMLYYNTPYYIPHQDPYVYVVVDGIL